METEQVDDKGGLGINKIWKNIKEGIFVEPEVYERRINACYNCELLEKGIKEKFDRCGACGCFIWAKAWSKKHKCGDKKNNRWEKI